MCTDRREEIDCTRYVRDDLRMGPVGLGDGMGKQSIICDFHLFQSEQIVICAQRDLTYYQSIYRLVLHLPRNLQEK